MILLALLPLCSFFVFFLIAQYLLQRNKEPQEQRKSLHPCPFAPLQFSFFCKEWRGSFIRAALIWGAYLVVVTELLSLVRGITVWGLTIAWTLPLILAIVFQIKIWGRGAWHAPWLATTRAHAVRPYTADNSILGNRILLLGVAAILVITALVAWVAPTQTFDSMNYHSPRVAHWAQERAVRHYATGIDVQNVLTPGAEMIVLHFYVLAGSDRLANFAAWLSLLGCIIVASWMAALMGADRRGQVLAAVLAATIPMGIVQASSTMTDLVAAFWVACTAAEALALWQGSENGIVWAASLPKPSHFPVFLPLVFISLGAGLALLTKPTAAAFVLPFGVLVGVLLWRRWGFRQMLLWGGIAAVLVFGLNAGHLMRNAALYGNPLGDSTRLSIHTNKLITPQGIASNLIRNAALHTGTPWGRANRLIYNSVLKIHEWLGLSVEDPRTTAIGPYPWMSVRTEENIAGNLLHAILIAWSMGVAVLARKRLGQVLGYGLLVSAGFVLFSAVFKWQVFGSRYHVPFFILFAPMVAVTLSVVLHRWAAWGVGVLLILWAVPWLFSIDSRPLVPTSERSYPVSILQAPRDELYFANATYLNYPYHEIAAYLKDADCLKLGLNMGNMALEYPLWVLLGAPRDDLQVEWLVAGPSSRYAKTEFQPCAVLCDSCEGQAEYNGLPQVFHYDTLRLYLQH
jgi:hypothetical protein